MNKIVFNFERKLTYLQNMFTINVGYSCHVQRYMRSEKYLKDQLLQEITSIKIYIDDVYRVKQDKDFEQESCFLMRQ